MSRESGGDSDQSPRAFCLSGLGKIPHLEHAEPFAGHSFERGDKQQYT